MRPTAIIVFLATVFAVEGAESQGNSDIFVGSITFDGGVIRIVDLVNATDRPGYDNQPSFMDNGSQILFTRGMDDGQTDIFRYTLADGRTERVTRTPESEYSPTLLPGGNSFAVIRVEADSTQRLWSFPLSGRDPELILPHLEPVGYQAWANDSVVAVFVLGQPPTLRIANTRSGEVALIAESVGRSIHRIPGQRDISFVHKLGEDEWWITKFDAASGQLIRVAATLPGREDYAWTPFGTIFMADGAVLYQWAPSGGGWSEIADLSTHGMGEISRIAVSPAGNHIALVGTR
ncbi:MAG: hypothetical protein OEZ54_13010 [Gemmatimonadota bacterium]|nr:hypothetical protein [Gemmatimonadota bacterium]